METKTKCCNKAKDAKCSEKKEMMKEQKSECKTGKCETKHEHECKDKKECEC